MRALATYQYVIATKAGKELKGAITADTRELAIQKIKEEGNLLISISEQSVLNKDVEISFLQKKPKPRDMSVFCRQFVSITEAGVPVISALEMLCEQTENKMLRKALEETKLSIEKGETLAGAMRRNRKIFPNLFITMVEAGEASGSLAISFTRMADQFEKEAHLKAMMKKATIYPAVVGVVAVAVIIGMLTFVIPTFEDMFAQLGTELPALTRVVMGASRFLISRWYLFAAIVIGLVLGVRAFSRTNTGKHLFGKLAMKVPLIGKVTVKGASSRFARTLSTLLAAGIPLINALDIVANTMTNIWFREALLDAKDDVSMGSALSEPLKKAGLFPPLVHHMLKIGEESGNSESMLDKLADYYDEEVEMATQSLMAAMEPLIIVVLAAIVGTIVIAIVLPMAQMYVGLDSL